MRTGLTRQQRNPAGFLSFTLHAHLPYVVNHGTWPHGLEWLHEAAAETYLPLLRVLGNLERDGIRFNCNFNISPILLEQLAHPVFVAEFPSYLQRKVVAAREDEAYFLQAGEHHLAQTARFWQHFFSLALKDFNGFDRNIVQAFRRFNDIGLIDIITCAATHGYMPLLGTDESLRAQIRTAVATHIRHLGKRPRGIWIPECGYRPAGSWSYPVTTAGDSPPTASFNRIGIEQALSESGIEFFVADTHLIEDSRPPDNSISHHPQAQPAVYNPHRTLYQPYYVDGPYTEIEAAIAAEATLQLTTVFPRDPRTGVQVWSGESGYPGDPAYLDFDRRRWPGGHRYWRVTGPYVPMDEKQPYSPEEAAERVQAHARHFAQLVGQILSPGSGDAIPPILCSPFDADLFGHWWFEGASWLEAVARALHTPESNIQLISCAEYLDRYPRAGSIAMHQGSWGAGGDSEVWLNPETSWTYTHIYSAELYTREVCTGSLWQDSPLGLRIVQQLCRELLLLESSDWQSLITTGAARDYAEKRFLTHNDQFDELRAVWQSFQSTGELDPTQQTRLCQIELRDNIFPNIDPAHWAAGSKEGPEKRSWRNPNQGPRRASRPIPLASPAEYLE